VDDDIHIALPVYRGTDFIAETVRSIREQTYSRFRVMMSVDGADDPTIDLCRSFTDDPRFELIVQPDRLGWPGNFNWLARRCDREFFCYWQQDDLASTGYLESLRNQLLLDPGASVAHTDVQWFGSKFHRDSTEGVFGTPLERVLQRIESIHYAPLRGLIRTSALPSGSDAIPTTPTGSTQAEFVFLTALAAKGSFHRVTTAMYFKRAHRDNAHTAWFAEEPHRRRNEWISTGVGMMRVALPLAEPEQYGRLLATVLDRFAIERPGRGFFYAPEQSETGVDTFVREFVDRAFESSSRIDLRTDDLVLGTGNGFERPVHPWIRTALEDQLARARTLRELNIDAADGAIELSTAAGGPGLSMLGVGWSRPEPWGIWTEGSRATIRLPAGQYTQVVLTGAAFVSDHPVRVGYSSAGAEPSYVSVADPVPITLAIDAPPERPHVERALQLLLPDACSPAAAGVSTDGRVLGFGLTGITFVLDSVEPTDGEFPLPP